LEDLIAKSFGVVLRRLRRERGFSQEVLGSKSKTQRKHISALELGDKQPTLNTIFRIAYALEIPPGQFIELVEVAIHINLGNGVAGEGEHES
jgi:transcriptional regulator with XRE-family HTH domain